MSWCPASVNLRDMQIKRTVSRYLSFLRVATNSSKQDPQKTTRVGENATVVDSRREDSMVQPLRKTVWRFLRRLTTELPYNLPIPLLAIEPQKPKSRSQTDRCTPMCIAALFATATERKQLKWVSPDAWINTHTKKKAGGVGGSGNPVTCSNLKKVRTLCQVRKASHKRTNSVCVLLYEVPRIHTDTRHRDRQNVESWFQGWTEGRMGTSCFMGTQILFCKMKKF